MTTEDASRRTPSTLAALIAGSAGGATQVLVGQPLVRYSPLLVLRSLVDHGSRDELDPVVSKRRS